MPDVTAATQYNFDSGVGLARAPEYDFGWMRAYRHFFEGVSAVAVAQLDLAVFMLAVSHPQEPWTMMPGLAGEAARRWFSGDSETLHETLLTHRLMDDGFADSFFAPPDTPVSGPGNDVEPQALQTMTPMQRQFAVIE